MQDVSIGINLQGMTINNLRFDIDNVLMADSVDDLQTLVTNIHTVSRKFGLTINKEKKRGPNDLQRKQAYVHLHWWGKTSSGCQTTFIPRSPLKEGSQARGPEADCQSNG